MANDKILDRVRALLAIAEHPNTPSHEADTALTQANRLMAKHAIEEATARAAQTREERRAVERKMFRIHEGDYSEFLGSMRAILSGICKHNRVQLVITSSYDTELFGMHDDIVWVEQQYMQIYFEFLRKLQPKWDESIGYDANIYNFKVAGYPWSQIDSIAQQNGHASRESMKTERWTHRITGEEMSNTYPTGYYHKLLGAYKRHMRVIGDTTPVATQTHSQYRRDFSDGFTSRIRARLEKMAADAAGEVDESAAVVLYDMSQEIKEEVYAAHPDLHPDEVRKEMREYQQAREERAAAERQARETMLNRMTDKQRAAFLDKERREEEREEARQERYWRKQAQKNRDYAGQVAGQRAASAVSLDRNAGSTEAARGRQELGA